MNRSIVQEDVTAVLEEKCKVIAQITRNISTLMSTTKDQYPLPGVMFAAEALKLHDKDIYSAMNTAEVVVATRVLTLNREWLNPVPVVAERWSIGSKRKK